jgi:hypothetical protein
LFDRTFKPFKPASVSIRLPVMPSLRQSASAFWLAFTNGSTASDCMSVERWSRK